MYQLKTAEKNMRISVQFVGDSTSADIEWTNNEILKMYRIVAVNGCGGAV